MRSSKKARPLIDTEQTFPVLMVLTGSNNVHLVTGKNTAHPGCYDSVVLEGERAGKSVYNAAQAYEYYTGSITLSN